MGLLSRKDMKSHEALYLTGEILEELMDEIEECREDGIDLESGMEERAEALREVLQMAKKFDDRNKDELYSSGEL